MITPFKSGAKYITKLPIKTAFCPYILSSLMAALEVVYCYFTVAYLWFTFFSDYYSLYQLRRLLGDPLEEFYSWLSLVLQYSTTSINGTTFVNQGSIYYYLI